MAEPLVSVGIPTFERAEKLARAVESVLAQTHAEIELVISDNASADGTRELCEGFAARDARVRYLRSPVNCGPTANFNTLFGELRGDHVMLLSDDDWLAPGYVQACLAALRAHPELVLACGRARYVREGEGEGEVVKQGVQMQLREPSAPARVLHYLREVDENGVFYGLMGREVLLRAAPLRNVLGNDWLLAAAIAAQGEVATIEEAEIYRELGGTSADFPRLARTLGLPHWQTWVPHLVIAWEVLRDVGGRAPAYRSLPAGSRARLALAGAWAVISWRSLAWHATMPAFAAAGRHRWGRPLWRAYERFTRALGAGRAS
jgi:glycosyltransferase involved in cell wall biosynthesis